MAKRPTIGRRKPKDPKAAEDFITGGAQTTPEPKAKASPSKSKPTQEEDEEEKPKGVLLRLLPSEIEAIDESCKARRPRRISRHGWILEAIAEKLEREEEED